MNYYSQHGEDKWIEENLKPEVGTFCEVGAFDGVLSSNTLHFEEIGWKGLLIEPDPIVAAQCAKNRKSQVWTGAVASNKNRQFFVNEQDRGLSGFSRPGIHAFVNVHTLSHILDQCGFRKVDLLSIDTEGSEIDVWSTLYHSKSWPKIVIMEYWTLPETPDPDRIIKRMARDGYREVHRTTCNLIFTL
jgi:FkbM family methyltransferase